MIDAHHDRLTFAPNAWEQLRPLQLDGNLFAAGLLRWRKGGEQSGETLYEALVDNLNVVDHVPEGMEYPPLEDYVVVGVRHEGRIDATELLKRIQPRASHTVIVLVLDAHERDHWDGIVFRDGSICPLDGFQVAGAGMLSVQRDERVVDSSSETDFTLAEAAFSRLRGGVPESVYRKLRRAYVTLIGASRNGTLVTHHMGALGIALLRMADPQLVGEENLDGMPGVPHDAIGQPKVHALADMILAQRPDMGVTCCEYSLLDPEAAGLFTGRTDLIVTAVDDEAARVTATIHARRMLVPHLDVATSVQRDANGAFRIFGDARLFLPGQGCAACAPRLTEEEREQVLYELAAPAGALHRGEELEWNQQRAGSLITINAITVAAGISSWLDLLSGSLRTSFWQRLDWIPGEGLRVRSSPVGAAAECQFCQIH